MGDLKKISVGLIFTYVAYLLICHSSFYAVCEILYVDKAFHIAGGYLIAALAYRLSGSSNPLILFSAVIAMGVAWEFLEVFFLNPWTFPALSEIGRAFVSYGDIAADVAGFFLYMISGREKINHAPAYIPGAPDDRNRLI